MGDDPPRRRARPKPPGDAPSLPFIPVIAGVVIVGFVIGAGLSVIGKHAAPDDVALATASPQVSSEPTAVPTLIPAVARTPHPTPSPVPSPVATHRATPSASASASATPAPTASPSATPAPTASPSASAGVTPAASATPAAERHVLAAAATHRPVSSAAPVASATPVAPVATATAVPETAFDADGAFSRLAGNVVRQYLLSIARGDLDSANAALGNAPGAHAVGLPEIGAIDSSMRIEKIEARGTDAAATVDVDLVTSSGPYYGQYTVHKSATGAAIIVSHTFGKP